MSGAEESGVGKKSKVGDVKIKEQSFLSVKVKIRSTCSLQNVVVQCMESEYSKPEHC